MRIVVSGASGMIGSALRSFFEEHGHTVEALVRDGRAPGIAWDPYAGVVDRASLEGCDAVVHLSGARIRAGRWTARHRQRVTESRVSTTRLLAETLAALDDPPQVMVSASAIGFYGDRGDEELTEESGAGDGFLAGLCESWEAATGPAASAGIRVARVRTGLVLAAGEGLLSVFVLPLGLAVAGRLGPGRQWMSWITLRDQVRSIAHVVEGDLAGAVNLTAPAPVTNREFSTLLARVLRRPKLPPVPAWAVRLAVGGVAAREAALASQRVLPTRLVESGFDFEHVELEAAFRSVFGRPA